MNSPLHHYNPSPPEHENDLLAHFPFLNSLLFESPSLRIDMLSPLPLPLHIRGLGLRLLPLYQGQSIGYPRKKM